MELKEYKKLSLRSIFIFLLFIILDGFYSYLGNVLGLHITYFFIGIIVGIVPGIIIAKQLRKNLVSNTIVFSEADKYKGLFYGAIIGNTVMVIVFVIIILSLESDSFSFDKVLESIIRVGTRLTSMVMGAVFIILIIQYIWISQYETKKDP